MDKIDFCKILQEKKIENLKKKNLEEFFLINTSK